MEKLAKFFGHDFDDGDFRLFDKNNNDIYYEYLNGYWYKYEYNKDGKIIYYIDSDDYWEKYEYDNDNNEIYFENSDGEITDNRPKTIDKEIVIDGKKYKLVEGEE